MNLSQHAQFVKTTQRPLRLGFAENLFQFVAYAIAADPLQQRQSVSDQFLTAGVEAKPQPALQPCGPQHAGGVIHKTETMQHADDAIAQVGLAAIKVQEFPPMVRVEADGERVDGEVTTVQILLD